MFDKAHKAGRNVDILPVIGANSQTNVQLFRNQPRDYEYGAFVGPKQISSLHCW